jgi:hypothetical protein
MTLDELQRRFPNARFVQVSLEVLESVPAHAAGRFVVAQTGGPEHFQIAQASTGVAQSGIAQTNSFTNAAGQVSSNLVEQTNAVPERARPREAVFGHHRHHDDGGSVFIDIVNTDWGGGDAAVVLYVLIGVVVVAAFIVYAVDYVYRLAVHPEDISYWWSLDLHSTWLAGGSEDGFFVGSKLSTGIIQEAARAGLSIEVGYFDVNVDIAGAPSELEVDGAYGMLGPHIRWTWNRARRNPSHFVVELLTGVTSSTDIDIVSVARAGVSLGVGEQGRLGLNIGTMYLDMELDEGLIRDDDDFSLVVGTEVGFRF